MCWSFTKHSPLCMSAGTHTLPQIQTHTDDPCSYLVYMNNDLNITKSSSGISFKWLRQNDKASECEDGISLNVWSQWQMWQVWMRQSQNSLKSSSFYTSDISRFHQGGSEIWEINLHMQAHHLLLPHWSCLSVDLWEAQYFRRLLGHGIHFNSQFSQAAMCGHVLSRPPVKPEHCEPETQ